MPDNPRHRGRPKGFNDSSDKTRIQALDRALDVLEVLADQGGLTLSEVAASLKQSPATIYRVLTTLQLRGMADTDPGDQTWHVGPGAFRIGSAFLRRSSVVERARPVMRMLMEETGETANLGIEKNGQVLFLSQVETHETIRAFFPPGTLSPMHASGIGKALLASMDDTRLFGEDDLESFTPKTLTSQSQLRADLALTRDRGFSFDDEERAEGMRCIAAPIYNLFGEAVAGISISGPTHRLDTARIQTIGALVRDAAHDLSRALGAS
ncbi:HTH-type transcriptional regulator BhcR [Shimia sp.]|uniref:HTH-type transcriptional regulator BhcR n=1 Tax=Shimia sp. TaxID=1954381 RepID=UPI003298B635